MLVHIFPSFFFNVPNWHPPPLLAATLLNRIIKSRRGGQSQPLFLSSSNRGSLRCCLRKSLLSVGFSEAFNPRGICISPVYPPTPTTLLPPSLTETHRAWGGKGPSAEWRIKGSHIPPALVSSQNLGSAMSSPVTLPYINLEKRQREERRKKKGLKSCCTRMKRCGWKV